MDATCSIEFGDALRRMAGKQSIPTPATALCWRNWRREERGDFETVVAGEDIEKWSFRANRVRESGVIRGDVALGVDARKTKKRFGCSPARAVSDGRFNLKTADELTANFR
jgi:hypothetical protein